jgi:RNA recognition motif-containing protein
MDERDEQTGGESEHQQQQHENGGGDDKKGANSRVYVAGLPPKVTRQQLEDAFAPHAKILSTRVAKSGRYAFLDFESPDVAQRVIDAMNNYNLNGSNLIVEAGKSEQRDDKRNKDGRKTARTKFRIIITGLNPNTSWQDLKDVMREAGGDVTFTSIKNNEGFAEFSTEPDRDNIVSKLDGTEINGYRVTVRRDDLVDRDLERDQPATRRDDRRRRDHGGGDRRRRQRSRSPSRRHRRSRERRRSRSRRSPDDRRDRRREREGGRDRDSGRARRRDDSASSGSGSRSPPRRRRGSRSD